jgi:hypothetical protein
MGCYEKMLEQYRQGADLLESVIDNVAEDKRDEAKRQLYLARFIQYTIVTTLNTKKWHILKGRLGVRVVSSAGHRMPDAVYLDEEVFRALPLTERDGIIREMAAIAENELENARRTLPLVAFDSRLGYEPSMEYMCDPAHLEWKIRVTQKAVEQELLPLLSDRV